VTPPFNPAQGESRMKSFRRLKPSSVLSILSIVAMAAVLPSFLQAQSPSPSPLPSPTPVLVAPDYVSLAAQAVTALSVILVPVLVWGIKKIFPPIPRAIVPFLALGAGNLLAFVGTLTPGGGHYSLLIGSLQGAAGLWLRETVNTIAEHGGDASTKA
jgi:hypothetical protein